MAGRPKPVSGELIESERVFIERYFIHLNRERAYRETGLSQSVHQGTQAMVMWNRPHVQAEIARRRKEMAAEAGINAQRIVDEYAKVALFNARDLYDANGQLIPVRDLDPDVAACITEITVDEIIAGDRMIGVTKKIKLASKIGALDSLAKHLKMFVDRVELTGKDGEALQVLMEQIGLDPQSRIKPK